MFHVNCRHGEAKAQQPDFPELMGTGDSSYVPGQKNQRGCNGVNARALLVGEKGELHVLRPACTPLHIG